MGHNIVSLVTKQIPIKEKLEYLDIPEIIENGFHIIPLDACHAKYWGEKWKTYDTGDHFGGNCIVCLKTIERILTEIGLSDFALIGTDYHGGIGNQAANVYKNSKRVIVEDSKTYNDFFLVGIDINTAPKEIGVVREEDKDEFDTINLSDHRCFEKYFIYYEKYCDQNNKL